MIRYIRVKGECSVNKQTMRKHMINKLKHLPKNEKIYIEQQLQQKLLNSILWNQADTIGITYSSDFEWDTTNIIKKCWELNKTIALPKCDVLNHQLHFYQVKNEEHLEKGYADLMEPRSNVTKSVHKKEIDLLVVPGVMFDTKGFRIGFGGGYYDRFLMDFEGETVSFAAQFQLVDKLPANSFDLPVQCIITEKKCIRI